MSAAIILFYVVVVLAAQAWFAYKTRQRRRGKR
jgi:hypothetical protein